MFCSGGTVERDLLLGEFDVLTDRGGTERMPCAVCTLLEQAEQWQILLAPDCARTLVPLLRGHRDGLETDATHR